MSIINMKKETKDTLQDDDNIYFNVVQVSTGTTQQAQFSITKTSEVLQKPYNYELSVVSFVIPTFIIPLLVWGTEPYQPNPNLPNYNPSSKVNKLAITLIDSGGASNTQFLEFIPNNVAFSPYGNAIYSIQQFVDMVNQAFEKAFYTDYPTNTIRRFPLEPPTVPPYLIFTPTTRLFSIICENTYSLGTTGTYPNNIPNTLRVFFNSELIRYITNFDFYFDNTVPNAEYQLLIKDNKNNTSGGNIIMEQENSTLNIFTDFSTILFETDSIPVNSEFQPSNNDATIRILTDFNPQSKFINNEEIQYNGEGYNKFYDLKSHQELRTIDIKVYWRDVYGSIYPIYVGGNETFQCKILFRKKITKALENLNWTKSKINRL